MWFIETSHTITMSMSSLTKHTVTKTSQIQGHLLILLLEFCLHTHCSLPCLEHTHTHTYTLTISLSLALSLSLSFSFFLSMKGLDVKKQTRLSITHVLFLFICCYFVFCFVVCCCCCWKWNRQSYHSFFRTPACSYSID